MALLGEEIVQEWLNLNGYFTIRGIKVNVNEIDILAIKYLSDGTIDLRHIECQISYKPMSYFTPATNDMQKADGRKANSARKRTPEQIKLCAGAWAYKKFDQPEKVAIKNALFPGLWRKELVTGRVKFDEELDAVRDNGINIIKFSDIIDKLFNEKTRFKAASGGDVFELMKWIKALD